MAVSYELPDTCASALVELPVLYSSPKLAPTAFHDIIFNGYVRLLSIFLSLVSLKSDSIIGQAITLPGTFQPCSLLPPFLVLRSRLVHSDWLVGNATSQSNLIPTANLTNGTTYSGQSTYGGFVYQTSVQYVSGYLSNTSIGINHNLSVGAPGTNAADGLVALMNVKILTNPSGASKSSCVFFFFFFLPQARRSGWLICRRSLRQSAAVFAGAAALLHLRCTHLDALGCIILTLIFPEPPPHLPPHGHARTTFHYLRPYIPS
jgi:hypothetical protein